MFDELKEQEFFEMSNCILNLITEWTDAICDIDDLRRSELPYKDIVDEDILLQYCIALNHACESISEEGFIQSLTNDSNFDDFNDFWGYHCGRRINPIINYYISGLQMAYKKLEEMYAK